MSFDLATAKPDEGFDLATARPVIEEPAEPKSSMTSIVSNAAAKGVAAVPDMLLNTPNRLWNLGKAAVGTAATAMGHPDLAPDLTPEPDYARRIMTALGTINPDVRPQGAVQKAADVLVQGAAGGALTGGASIPRTLAGAGMGALATGTSAGAEHLTGNPSIGMAAGLMVPGLVGAMAGRPNLSPNAKILADEGVQMTPGQIKGGVIKRIEDAATSLPFLGDAIKSAQRRSVESFDAAAINRGLAPIGAELPKNIKGNQAIEYAYGKLGGAYEELLPKLRGDLDGITIGAGTGTGTSVAAHQAQPSLRQELDNIRQMGANLPEPQQGQLNRIIDREVIDRFTSGGNASGETLKDMESELGRIAKDSRQSKNYDERNLGAAVQEVQAALRRMITNVNPTQAGELAKINTGYANFKIAQNAAGRVGAQEGVFSPAQLHGAVRSGDRSLDKARFAEGNALMQDLSAAGKDVLPSSVPDSGTPFRAGVMAAATHPAKAALLGIPLAAGATAYTPAVQKALQSLMTGESPNLAAAATRSIIPMAADQGMGLAFPQQQPAAKPAEQPKKKTGFRVKVLSHDENGRVSELMIVPHDGEVTGTLQ